MTLTDFLAVWGAILSTLALMWNVFRDVMDRSDVRLDFLIGFPVPHARNPGQIAAFKTAKRTEDATHLHITITNHGRRAALVTKLVIEHVGERGASLVVPHSLPTMLKENEFTNEYTDDISVLRRPIKRIYVVDSTGKKWPMRRNRLSELHRRVTELGLMKDDR